jgi:hypothetical protein
MNDLDDFTRALDFETGRRKVIEAISQSPVVREARKHPVVFYIQYCDCEGGYPTGEDNLCAVCGVPFDRDHEE